MLDNMVRIHPLPPYMANEKDVRQEKRVFTRFFVALMLNNIYTKPKMTFGFFEYEAGVELSQKGFWSVYAHRFKATAYIFKQKVSRIFKPVFVGISQK